MPLNLAIELMVAALLTLTIIYCYRLNKKITALRADEEGLMGTIAELVDATETAERAVGSMRHAAAASQQEIVGQINDAEDISETLHREVEAAKLLLSELKNAKAGQPAVPTATANPAPAAGKARQQAEESARRLEALRALRKQAA